MPLQYPSSHRQHPPLESRSTREPRLILTRTPRADECAEEKSHRPHEHESFDRSEDEDHEEEIDLNVLRNCSGNRDDQSRNGWRDEECEKAAR